MTTLVADVEADGLLDTVTTIWQINTINIDTLERRSFNDHGGEPLADGYAYLLAADKLIMHHGLGYDRIVLSRIAGVDVPPERVIDTLVLSRLGNPTRDDGHSLDAWGRRLALPIPKVEHDDWTQWSPEMARRCAVDCEITLGVWERLRGMYDVMPDAIATEHAVAHEIAQATGRGFQLDVNYCRKLLGELLEEQEAQLADFTRRFPPILVPKNANDPVKTLKNINRKHPLHGQLEPGAPYCPVVVQEFNPASRQQIAKRLITKYGWRPTKFTSGGSPEVSEDILRDLPFEEAQALADYLTTDKMIGQINAEPKSNGKGGGWLHHIDENARVHASLNPDATVTHRMTCSAPNLQQVNKKDRRMRLAWVAELGWVLVGVDAEGLELRGLAHYLSPLDDGAYTKMLLVGRKEDGTDVHSVAMRLIGFYDRDQTKRAEYGWLYGAGDAKLGLIALQDAQLAGQEIQYGLLGLAKRPGKRPSNTAVGKAIRARLEEGITGLGQLSRGIRSRAKSAGKLRGIDGRSLWVRSEHSALNLLLQSAGVIAVKKAMTLVTPALTAEGLVEDRDFRLVLQVHDELQFEARPECAEAVGRVVADCIRVAGEELGFRCPLAGAYQIGPSWADTH